jgi:oligopeptide transport system substrate-binding protein
MRSSQVVLILVGWVSLLAGVLVLPGCSSPEGGTSGRTSNAPPVPAGVVRFNQNASPKFLDPSLLYDIPSFNAVIHLFEPLVRTNPDGEYIPADAESWTHSDDYMTWTFKLRPGGKWSNGAPRTAHDYVYGIRRILTPATGANYASMVFMFLEGGEEFYKSEGKDDSNLGIRALDDLTIEYRLVNPAPYFLSLVQHSAWFPLHEGTIKEHGDSWWTKPETYVSNGPFKLDQWLPKDRLVMSKNPHFWDAENIHFNQVIMRLIENESTEQQAFLAGDIDMTASIPSREADQWRDKPEFFSKPMIGKEYIAINNKRAPFDNVDVRRAFSLAINRPLITERITRKGETPSKGFIPRGIIMHTGKDYRDHAPAFIDNSNYEESVKKAKEAIARAGYGPGGKSMGRIEHAYNETEMNRDVAEILQRLWSDTLGVETSLAVMEWPTLLDKLENLDYAICRGSWIGDYADPLTFLEIFESTNGNNRTGYASAKYDAAFEAARSERDADKRLELLIECERILLEEDAVIAPVFERVISVLKRPELEGVVITPMSVTDVSRSWRRGEHNPGS